MIEEWREIEGYEGLYMVSNYGEVKGKDRFDSRGHFRKSLILKPTKNTSGYLRVTLNKLGHGKNVEIHKIVANAFIPNEDKKEEIDHIDGMRTNNRVDNLQWVTRKENQNNPITKKRRVLRMTGKVGKNSSAKKPVVCTETGEFFWGGCEAERITGISNACISMACRGVTKSAGGYHWRFATKEDVNKENREITNVL